MAEEDEWKKLPTDQKCQHKAWKARAEGYKECIKNFAKWDEDSPEFSKYLGLVKKFVTDPNELVKMQGVEAVLLFVSNANVAKKTCGEVVSGIIQKCFNTKPRLKDSAIDVCLMYIEIDRNEQTMEAIVKGFPSKQPKVATACFEAATKALSLFGSKVIQVKPLVKEIPALADHRDKNVREAVKALAIEIYRWVGPAIKASLQNLNPVMLKDLEEEWVKVDASGKPKQTRFMRSQQDLREKMEAKEAASAEGGSGDAREVEEPEIDSYDLLDPVEILSKLPKKFYEQIEAKKWQERKEMLEECQKLCETPKIEPGDFGDLVKALKKVVAKDTNIMLVTIAAKCLAGLASGIRKKFHPFATSCIDVVFDKFKEKKPAVVAALQEAADAIYLSTTLQGLSETCIEYLENKNPSIREQTALFLARALSKTKASALNKSTVKPLVQGLLKNIDHSAPSVRGATYNALGMLLKLCGEKLVMGFLADLDNLKLEKIKEYAGKAEVAGKVGAAKTVASAPEQVKSAVPSTAKPAASKPSGAKKKVVKGGGKKPAGKKEPQQSEAAKPQEPVLGDAAVEDQVAEFLPAEVVTQLANNNWKERLEGLQSLTQKMKLSDVKSIPCQALVKTLGSGKQGWKDTNFNCLNEKFGIVKNLAENASFSKTSAEICIPGLIEKIGDVKCGKASKDAITAIAEATSFPWVSEMLLEIAMVHKNPKIQSESLAWLTDAVKEFGLGGANIKLFVAKVKVGFAATNPAVRTAAFNVMSAMTLYIGAKIRMFFESEKPAILQQIDAEIEKCKGQSPPVPTRGGKVSKQDDESDAENDDEAPAEINVEDLVTRMNVADKITDALVSKLSDKNWKMRREALEEVTAILDEAKYVEPDIGELANALKARLSDSNKLLITTSLSILLQLSTALGPHCKVHVKTVAPGMVNVLADSKANVRQASLNAMNNWLENTSLSPWFEDEIMSSALSVPKHAFLRIELLNWLAEKLLSTPKLTSSAKEGLEACVKHVYACCEDRTGDVRAKAQAVLPAFIYHLGMDKMVRLCGKLGSVSVTTIQGLLDKAKEHVPARKGKTSQKPKPAAAAPVEIEFDVPSSEPPKEEAKSAAPAKSKSGSKSKLNKRPASLKKLAEEPESGPALVRIPNGKEQRLKEEQKLKTLKWVFDTPRDELVSQLKTQMTSCVGSGLATELFHADFQRHIKAIVILSQALEQQWEETIGTMDMILRWITLRFYEKNTTVHMKCLEYLKNLFERLNDSNYRMSDYEAVAFIPHLITKIGETKENIRKDVHTIMHQITLVYPAGKVFNHLMQGLLTKNSRQKTECLDELGSLITSHGMEVCQPTPPKALREIATHIGDRDNGVRSAALNVAVCAYNNCGDIIYKYVGKLNEKDMSMLEERIKRSGKFGTEAAVSAPAKTEPKGLKLPSKAGAAVKSKISTSHLHSSGTVDKRKAEHPEDWESEYKMPELLPTDMADDLLREPDIEIPPRFVSSLPHFRNRNTNESVNATLDALISTLASNDMDECLKSIHQLDEIMKHNDKRQLLKPRVDQILTSSCIQIRMGMNRYIADVSMDGNDFDGGDANHKVLKLQSLFKCLFAINLTIAKSLDLALCASQNSLQDFIHAVNLFLLDKRLKETLPNAERLVQVLNMLVGGLFNNANSTYVMCAVLQLLSKSLENATASQRELAIRCLWKVIHMLEDFMTPPEGSLRPPLKPAAVLADIQSLYLSLSSVRNAANKDQISLMMRSIRSLISKFCEILGIRILDEVEDVEGIESSELLQIIVKSLKSRYSVEEIESHPVKQRLTQSSAEKKENIGITNGDVGPERKLSRIVKKVGDYELTREGLQELYDFKQQYPDYDIESKFTNPLFLNYVRRSLLRIEQERKNGVYTLSNVLKTSDTNQPKTANEHMEHIKKLRLLCGLPVDSGTFGKVESKVLATNNGALNRVKSGGMDSDRDKQLHAPIAKSIDLQSSGAAAEVLESNVIPPRPASTSTMENLKRRLEKIKKESRQRK